MTITRKRNTRSSPDSLPAARLYLDDIRDIVQVMSTPADKDAQPSTVKYYADAFECDSLEELAEIGGTTRKFEVRVSSNHRTSVLAIKRAFTTLTIPAPQAESLIKEKQIREIFESNAVWWKNLMWGILGLFDRVPFWFLFLLASPVFIAILLPPSSKLHTALDTGWVPTIAIPVAVLTVLFFFGGSVVVLQHAHKRGITRWLETNGWSLFLVVLSAVLGAVLKAVFDSFLRK